MEYNTFKKYQHVKRYGSSETRGIENGKCYVFPKIDGTNSSVWLKGEKEIGCGSRNRELSIEDDNAGFCKWMSSQYKIREFLIDHAGLRLYGEWLVPHSLKTYKDSAWRDFYVFDVMYGDEYLPYPEYKALLDLYGINYIPPICVIENGSYDDFVNTLDKNDFLIEDGVGEGIVIKNYDFVNKYGRTTWAKIVTSEFKASKKQPKHKSDENVRVEEAIAESFVTKALCEKVQAKIINEKGEFDSKDIPRLLNTVYHDVIREDMLDIIKKFKAPTIDFKMLAHFVFKKVKEHLPETF